MYVHGVWREAMAVGLGLSSADGQYNGRMTRLVVLSCLVAATGGIIFGYDLGISGFLHNPTTFLHPTFLL